MNDSNAQPTPDGDNGSAPKGRGQTRGAGPDGSIPESDEGISLTTTEDESNFNPEEDSGARTRPPGRPGPEK